jgi:signal transduction histidine kinase/DNA-binding response OmpR family regulator/ligand-binding sensor domain-containing protein
MAKTVNKILFFYFCLLSFVSIAQRPNVHFKNINLKEGIQDNHIVDILQDDYGYMWIASQRGLDRFDGINTVNFNLYEIINFDDKILNLELNAEGGIWIQTESELIQYSSGKFFNENFFIENQIELENISHTPGKNLFYTDDGLYQFDTETREYCKQTIVESTNGEFSFLNHANVYYMQYDESFNNQWICTTELGVFKKNLITQEISSFEFDKNNSYQNSQIKKILSDDLGNTWLFTTSGLWFKSNIDKYPKTVKVENYQNFNNLLLDVEKDKNGNLWCSLYDVGIVVLNNRNNIIEHFVNEGANKSGLSSRFAHKLIFDNSENLWLGHQETGVDVLSTSFIDKIGYFPNLVQQGGIVSSKVIKVMPIKNNSILVANELLEDPTISKLSVIAAKNIRFTSNSQSIKKLNIGSINIDINDIFSINNDVIVSSYDEAYIFNENQLKSTSSEIINISSEIIQFDEYVMYHYNNDGKYWLLGQNLRLFDLENNKEKTYMEDLNLDRFIIDKQNFLWGIESNNGLQIIDLESKEVLSSYVSNHLNPNSISDNNINLIFTDSNEKIWIGTENGLNEVIISTSFENKRENYLELLKNLNLKHYKVEDGLSGNSVKSILEDDQKRLWISTENGISVLDLETKKIHKLGVNEGIQKSGFVVDSSAKSEDGTLYFGGDSGIIFFRPDQIKFETIKSNVAINEIKVSKKYVGFESELVIPESIPEGIEHINQISLDYNSNSIFIGFTAIDYSDPIVTEYEYKLDGFDKDWKSEANILGAFYPNLPFGEYKFRLRAKTQNKQWSEEKILILTINPPFWLSGIFIFGSFVFLTFFFIFYSKVRLNIVKRQRNDLKIIADQRLTKLIEVNKDLQKQKNDIESKNRRLKELNETISETNSQKMNFYTNISHELRTPLTVILSPIKELLLSFDLPETARQKIALIYKSSTRLQELVDQLLQFRTMESGNLKLNPTEGDIILFIKKISDHFVDYAKEYGIALEYNSKTSTLFTWFDEDKLYKIISNLLLNSVKYNYKGGKVNVRVLVDESEKSNQKYVQIEISDTGIGMTKTDLNKIFEPFYQSQDTNTKAGGTGIGLSYTRSLVKLLGGKITVKSKLGKGSKFTVSIPQVHKLATKNNLDTFHYKSDVFEKIEFNDLIENIVNKDLDLNEINPDPLKQTILLVEDNLVLGKMVQKYLNVEYNVHIEKNGFEALKFLENNDTIDIIISDIMMPLMNGLEFCKRVKSNVATSHIPLILLTAKDSEKSIIKGLTCKADHYIIKPFNEEILKIKIKNLIDSREQIKLKFLNDRLIEPIEISQNNIDREIVEKAISIVENEMSNNDFSVKILSSKMAMSSSTFLRKIKGITGLTCDQFIRSIRLKRAANFLSNTKTPVKEISYSVGFSSQKHFSTTFKKSFGMSPTTYHKKYFKANYNVI